MDYEEVGLVALAYTLGELGKEYQCESDQPEIDKVVSLLRDNNILFDHAPVFGAWSMKGDSSDSKCAFRYWDYLWSDLESAWSFWAGMGRPRNVKFFRIVDPVAMESVETMSFKVPKDGWRMSQGGTIIRS